MAIAAAFLQLARWLRGLLARKQIRSKLQVLCGLDAELREVVISLDSAFTAGTGWRGMVEFPAALKTLIDRLLSQRQELDRVIAAIRAIWAEGANERARASVEEAAEGLREAVEVYMAGAREKYLDSMGNPIPHGATGRGYTHAIPTGVEESMQRFRRKVRENLRSAVLQLGPSELEDQALAVWPVREWEVTAPPEVVDSFMLPAGT